jgi:predicted membrane protein
MYSFASRTVSLLLALVLSALVLLLPHTLTNQDDTVNHSLLMLLMIGTMLGFIHGVGFSAKPMLGYLISPILAWPIMIGGILWLTIEKTAIL